MQPPPRRPIELLFYSTRDAGGPLGADAEEHDILSALRDGGASARFNVRMVEDGDIAHIDTWLDDVPYRVVHLSAHGTEEGEIYAEGLYGPYRASGEALARHFAGRGIDLVVVSACYALPVAEAIAPHVGAVVAADDVLGFDTVAFFNRGFYEKLGRGATVAEAFANGCNRARIAVGPTEHLVYRGDGDRRLSEPGAPSSTESKSGWDVCILSSPALEPICRRMAALLMPHRTIYLGHDADPTAFVDAVDDGLATARVVMVLYEPDVYGEENGEAISRQRAEELWDLRDQVIGAVAERIADTEKRLFPVYLDGRPPRNRIYRGLRRVQGLDVTKYGGIERAMREVERLFLRADG